MEKYDFDSMGALWADQARKIVENGVFVANSGGWKNINREFLAAYGIA